MSISAYLIDKQQNIISDDYVIDNDENFAELINIARSLDKTVAIKWQRSTDGQIAYWGPKGAQLHPHWFNGNQNAATDDGATSFLHVRCTPDEKASWVNAANGIKLASWVKNQLNEAASFKA